MSFDQGEFDFDAPGGDGGYRRWVEQLDAAKRAFELRWGVILDRPVRVRLEGHKRSLEGIVRLVSPPRGADPKSIRLRVGSLDFSPAEIESIVSLDS